MTAANNDDVCTLVCLHSSGGSGRQWDDLREHLGDRFDVLTPDLIGYGETEFGFGEPLHMEDEVAAVVNYIQAAGGRAHLIGHSYGAAVATHVALSHPDAVASLAVYEPVLFALLYEPDRTSMAAGEIQRVADSIISQLDTIHGRWQGARDFINYWSGHDAWGCFNSRQRARLVRLMPKIAAEFHALARAGTTVEALAGLRMPVSLLYGSETRQAARLIANRVAEHAPCVEIRRLEGLGHMAPVTHAEAVLPLIVGHVIDCSSMCEAAVA